MPTVKGVEAPNYFSPSKDSETEDYDEKLKRQQKELLRSQEVVIQQQEKALLQQQQTINYQQCMLQDQQGQQSSTRAQEVVACSSTSTHGSVLPGTSFRTGGAGTIDKFLKPSALGFLHRVKPEVVEIKDDDVIAENIPGLSTSSQPEVSPEKMLYLPKQIPETENLVLVPAHVKKGTSLQSSV